LCIVPKYQQAITLTMLVHIKRLMNYNIFVFYIQMVIRGILQ